jgi:hypothetical protein
MAYYRILKRVSKGAPVGSLDRFDWLNDDQRQRLVDLGVISQLSAPPLAELPGLSRRAKKLEPLGIVTADQFLECDIGVVSGLFRVKPETVERWQDEVMKWLIIPEPARSG